MMKKISLLVVMVGFLAFTAAPVLAISLSIDPSFQEIPVGGTASVNLVVSGLGDSAPPSIGAFAVSVAYDDSILSLTSVLFGSYLGTPGVDADAYVDASIPGEVYLDEVSFILFPDELDALQPASFALATLGFTGVAAGFSNLDFSFADLGDAFGNSISGVATTGAGVAPVPEPATMLLLGTGFVALAGMGKKKMIKR
jgi:hypothetical protein